MASRGFREYLSIMLKGMAMGAAEVVPGVSGGTLAFITGIYEELVQSIAACNPAVFGILKRDGVAAVWRHVNGDFLLALVIGMAISIVSFAGLITWLMDHHAIVLWSFFFGLIVASIVMLLLEVPHWRPSLSLFAAVGAVVGCAISIAPPMQVDGSLPLYFFAGAIAVCAWILPGVSGSFMLLLMGLYAPVMVAIKTFDLPILLIFAAGCGLGLMAFSSVVAYAFNHYRGETLLFLTGLMAGSLIKLWPWQVVHSYHFKENADPVPLEQSPVLPGVFYESTGDPPLIAGALAGLVAGLIVVALMHMVNVRNRPTAS